MEQNCYKNLWEMELRAGSYTFHLFSSPMLTWKYMVQETNLRAFLIDSLNILLA